MIIANNNMKLVDSLKELEARSLKLKLKTLEFNFKQKFNFKKFNFK